MAAEPQALVAIGCNSVQGYAMSRPRTAEEITRLLSWRRDQTPCGVDRAVGIGQQNYLV